MLYWSLGSMCRNRARQSVILGILRLMSTISGDTARLLPYFFLRGVGPKSLKNLAKSALFHSEADDRPLEYDIRIKRALEESGAWSNARERAAKEIHRADNEGINILSVLDPEYSLALASTTDAPCFLFAKGNVSALSMRSVAVVGSRKPTDHGKVIAERVSKFLVENRWAVVSGLALGCDTVAHETVVGGGGTAIAVLGHGLHSITPKKNLELAQRILDENGLLISEFSYATAPAPFLFVRRDRTQAGLAHGTVLVQSTMNGGSLNASRASIEYGRWLAVTHPAPHDLKHTPAKVGANVVLSGSDEREIKELLALRREALDHLFVLRGKQDYEKFRELDFQPIAHEQLL